MLREPIGFESVFLSVQIEAFPNEIAKNIGFMQPSQELKWCILQVTSAIAKILTETRGKQCLLPFIEAYCTRALATAGHLFIASASSNESRTIL